MTLPKTKDAPLIEGKDFDVIAIGSADGDFMIKCNVQPFENRIFRFNNLRFVEDIGDECEDESGVFKFDYTIHDAELQLEVTQQTDFYAAKILRTILMNVAAEFTDQDGNKVENVEYEGNEPIYVEGEE